MKRMVFFVLLLLSATLLPGAEASKDDPRYAAVLELLDACRTPQTLDATVSAMAELQVRENPELAPARQILLDFYRECFAFDSLKDEIVAVYLANFTLEELQAITAFYRTPAGRKLAERGVELSAAGMNIGSERMRKKLPELQKKIEKKLAE